MCGVREKQKKERDSLIQNIGLRYMKKKNTKFFIINIECIIIIINFFLLYYSFKYFIIYYSFIDQFISWIINILVNNLFIIFFYLFLNINICLLT